MKRGQYNCYKYANSCDNKQIQAAPHRHLTNTYQQAATGWSANLFEHAVHDLPDLIGIGPWPLCHIITVTLYSPAKLTTPYITAPPSTATCMYCCWSPASVAAMHCYSALQCVLAHIQAWSYHGPQPRQSLQHEICSRSSAVWAS